MFRLALTIYGLISTTLAGVGVVVALVAGWTSLLALLAAAGTGLLIAAPVSLYVAHRMGG